MQAVAVALATSGVWHSAHAQQAFSNAWFAARGAAQATASQTGRLPNGMPVTSLMDPSAQQQQANAQLQRSIANLGTAAQNIAAMQATQANARAAAGNTDATIPDGLSEGGLKVDTNSLTKGWINAQAPTQTSANGKTNVNIAQTADKAILNWETFNVGRNTSVNFAQQSDWAALNRVNDPNARPSQIQGQIHGDGTVLILNRNGVIFGGTSQVDTRNLVVAAARMSDAQFQTGGIYGANGTTPSFTDALGKVEVQAGANITTRTPTSVTQGGGYVLLLGNQVSNAGAIVTPQGQVALAAGDSFVIRKGVGTDANTASTTRGNEISPQFVAQSTAGKVVNTGLLMASEGDITLAGRDVQQLGTAVSTTTVNTRGTIHLLNSASDTQGKVTLGSGALTSVLISDSGATALDSQRTALIQDGAAQDLIRRQSAAGMFDNLSRLDDRRDQSRVEIVSGGNVEFQSDSLTLATGGQIAVSATGRSFVANRAQLDVSGAVGVSLSMDSNNVKVNVQGNEQRDAPGNRDNAALNNANVWIDRRRLVYVPASVGGYANERWYTPGGLLEVGGYLANQAHGIGEWAAQGGTVTLAGGNAVTQAGSVINVSGGSLDVQTGFLNQTWLRGADGQIYNANSAPAGITYTSVYTGFEVQHPRWGTTTTESYANPIIAPQRVLQNGYTVGRDAGRLVVSTPTATMAGDVVAATYQGPTQVKGADATIADGYAQAQQAAPRGAELILGSYQSASNSSSTLGATGVFYNLSPVARTIVFTGDAPAANDSANDPNTTIALDSQYVSRFGLGAIRAAANDTLRVEGTLSVGPGGTIALYAPQVGIGADLVAHGGAISLGNVVSTVAQSGARVEGSLTPANGLGNVTVADGVRLDTSGLWTNLALDGSTTSALPFVNGGDVTMKSTGDVNVGAGTLIDVSSGGVMRANATIDGGAGGDVTLNAGYSINSLSTPGRLTWLGDVRAYGVTGGGTLNVQSGGTILIGQVTDVAATTGGVNPPPSLRLDPARFQTGFSNYVVNAHDGLTVADGTTLDVTMPVLRADPDIARASVTGSRPAALFSVWTPPVYSENPLSATLTQRGGASLALSAGYDGSPATAPLTIGHGATITVDPKQSIGLTSEGQMTIGGTLNAWGGSLTLAATGQSAGTGYSNVPARSIVIGDDARLDVAARAYVAYDAQGRAYGVAPNGGSITVNPSDAFLVIRPGAVLDASGASARVDRNAGSAASGAPDLVTLAGNGGNIALHSNNGFVLDGTLRAEAGAANAGAQGGTLGVYFDTRSYVGTAGLPAQIGNLHDITLVQTAPPPDPTGSDPQYGQAVIGVDRLTRGGFDNLVLSTNDRFVFQGDLNLSLAGSVNLKGGLLTVSGQTPDAQVRIAAPYIRLDGGSWSAPTIFGDTFVPGIFSLRAGQASAGNSALTFSANLIDVSGRVVSGAQAWQGLGSIGGTTVPTQWFAQDGFADLSLVSTGDIRLAGGLNSQGNINLTAAQIYPVSSAYAAVVAGDRFTGIAPDSHLTIRSNGGVVPDVPYSVFGQLILMGGTVDQGGVVRAPLGVVSLNTTGGNLGADWTSVLLLGQDGTLNATQTDPTVILRSGSLTSASAAGLDMPYGGTSDGVTYRGVNIGGRYATQYNLADTFVSRGDTSGGKAGDTRVLVSGVNIGAAHFIGESGAVIDLSGGGTLQGEGFVSGRGGSVNVLNTPLVNANPAANTYSKASDQVYAIVPSYQGAYAPVVLDKGAGDPAIGKQITIGDGVPGLPAGTYTLMPSSFALMPGAYRVELAGSVPLRQGTRVPVMATGDGSWMTTGVQGTAGTGQLDTQLTRLIVTPGGAVRKFSQFNETTFSQFLLAQSAQFGTVRSRLPEDGKLLNVSFMPATTPGEALNFAGTVRFDGATTPAVTGVEGALFITGGQSVIEIRSPGAAPTPGMVSLVDRDLNAFAAPSLGLGGYWTYFDGQSTLGDSARLFFGNDGLIYNGVTVRSGASLRAGQVFLVGNNVTVEAGATIDTRGFSDNVIDSRYGYVYATGLIAGQNLGYHPGLLAVGNGWLDFLPSDGIGSVSVGDGASLLTQGTIAFAAPNNLSLGNVNLGARYLTVSQNQINIGDSAAMSAAGNAGVLPAGWQLSQAVLDKLLRPSATSGLPALQRLTLTAGGAFNFFGSATLDTGDSPVQMVFNSPAFYGLGSSTDVVRLSTANFLWNGVATGAGTATNPFGSQAPAAVVAGGPGTGAGKLIIDARTIEFGYDDLSQPQSQTPLDRLALGFSGVTLQASEKVTANHLGTLSVGGTQAANGTRSGGDLNLVTPLVTGKPGASMTYNAGGNIVVTAPSGVSPSSTDTQNDLGASLAFNAKSVTIDTALALPSGKLSVAADGTITLGAAARLDLAGRDTTFFDVTQPSWGGKVLLASANGDVTLQSGSVVDVSAAHAAAGSVSLSAPQGQVLVGGTLSGTSGQGQTSGQFSLDSGSLSNAGFSALNQTLSDAGFFASRSFRLRHGDLTVGDGVRATNISIATDNGSLNVVGTIDASGATPGSIILSALGDVTLAGSAVLDAHATSLVTDSQGAAVDASNRANIALTSTSGTVRLGGGARFDMRSPDGVARGQLDINAPRTDETSGDIRIDASAPPDIRGARSIAVNGFWTYTPTDANGTVTQDNGDAAGRPIGADGVAGLAQIDARSRQFIDNAWGNASLQSRLAGLAAYGDAFHLRPGVAITSTSDINTRGDLDLAGYRYGPGVIAGVRGSGEPGVLVLRAGGDLKINGSVTDGFGTPVSSPDGAVFQTVLSAVTLTGPYTVAAGGMTLGVGTKLPTTGTLNFSLSVATGTQLYLSDTAHLPIDVVLGGSSISSNRLKSGVVTTADIILPAGYTMKNGTVVGAGGYRIAAGTNTSTLVGIVGTTVNNMLLPPGTILKAGMNAIQFSDAGAYVMKVAATVWPAGVSIAPIKNYTLAAPLDVAQGSVLPTGMYVSTGDAQVGDRPIWAIAPMLDPGTLSWSMRMVGGSDLTSADSRAVLGTAQGGDIVLNDPFTVNVLGKGRGTPAAGISVVRTGTGDLELFAAGDYRQLSPFGVYTAGTSVAGTGAGTQWNAPRALASDGTYFGNNVTARAAYEATLNAQRMWYTQDGGNFTLSAGGDILGWQEPNSEMVGTWVLRQGGAALGQSTAWGINFGTYALDGSVSSGALGLAAFSGMGALGGGAVNVRAGGNIGTDDPTSKRNIVVAVGGSGRVTDAGIVQTGGGVLNVAAGGNLYGGLYSDLRGDTTVTADGNIGLIQLRDYGVAQLQDPRGLSSHKAYAAFSRDGASVAPGDGSVTLQALGDLVMGKVIDPGRAEERVQTQASLGGVSTNAASWFTLWQNDTRLSLFSAGGNASPLGNTSSESSTTLYLPPILDVTAAGGSIYFAPRQSADYLMPSPDGNFQFLAKDNVSGVSSNNVSNISGTFGALGTSLSSLATPQQPGWQTRQASNYWNGGIDFDNASNEIIYSSSYNLGYGKYLGQGGGLVMFGPNTLTDTSADGNSTISRIYALTGDIQSVNVGQIKTFFNGNGANATYYWASKPVQLVAGGDIVNSSGLINQTRESDVSMLAAGGNIFYQGANSTGFTVTGPGTFEVSAGGDIYLGNTANFTSLGPLVPGDARPGASIAVQAGLGAGKPGLGQTDVAAFAQRYFDPANLADAAQPLADQTGKVAKTYDAELLVWLQSRFGYTGAGGAQALAWFLTLPGEQQRVFVRQVYYAELLAAGREYNDVSGKRYGSYLRGREAIATLFPETAANGEPISRSGGLTLFQGLSTNGGVRTIAGGNIELLVPGGQTTLGVEGVTPSVSATTVPAGVLTQGEGDIRIYSEGSILLGLSRVMTTFGGAIQGWSAEGDINAGRGAKTTVLYTPPRRVYDAWGNVTLSPNVPSSGAGIATLNPIPEVRPGDVDLVAPLGTIDAGEAGIRVSGNVNFAALAVVNAANVQVQGKSTGLPVIAAVNVGALTNASATAAQAATAAQDAVARDRAAQRQNTPSIFTVRMLSNAAGPTERGTGAGGTQDDGSATGAGSQSSAYDRRNRVQIVGHGADLSPRAMSLLTPDERAQLRADR
ncbi:filamentous haemagglutinin family protein [Pandoraea apista]|uniref:filamentous haemagglutinin family protein n=1 Tax=Pandoraea apista TaxID=93218 RepID=UPI00069B9F3F|nr:filamentous haemagglutinin family protein [Pandoraea apista]